MPRVEESSIDDYLEWVIEKEFVRDLEDAGWMCLKADKIKRGWSDQICFGSGPRTVIVEFKKKGAKKRKGEKLQQYYRNKFKDLGYEVHKVTGKEQANELRTKLLARVR